MQDLDTCIDEVSVLVDTQTLMELYHTATREPYSFLCVKLTASDRGEMFCNNFDKRLILQDEWMMRKSIGAYSADSW